MNQLSDFSCIISRAHQIEDLLVGQCDYMGKEFYHQLVSASLFTTSQLTKEKDYITVLHLFVIFCVGLCLLCGIFLLLKVIAGNIFLVVFFVSVRILLMFVWDLSITAADWNCGLATIMILESSKFFQVICLRVDKNWIKLFYDMNIVNLGKLF